MSLQLRNDLIAAGIIFANAEFLHKGVWLTRGAVRCDLLGALRPWDDLDFITLANPAELMKLADITPTETNFHGGHRFWLPSGRKADVWSAYHTFGHDCNTLVEAARQFEFTIDTFMYSWTEDGTVTLSDPLNNFGDLKTRLLKFQRNINLSLLDERTIDFLAYKSVYLILRHNLRPDEALISVCDFSTGTDLPAQVINNMQAELEQLGRSNLRDGLGIIGSLPSAARRIARVLTSA